ncbi:MAG: hypothetical protein HZA88_00610 [Verrucomicrobia bacterium]|nr:hypothetical protein [Verrucomicrobiota bacterium]
MRLPNPKNTGDRISHGEWNDVLAHARSNAIVNSPDIVAAHGAGGTSLFLTKRPSLTSIIKVLHQFEIYQSPDNELVDAPEDWRTFKVHTGRVSCKTPDNDDASEEPLSVVVPASTEKYYWWAECQVKVSDSGDALIEPIVTEVTIKHATDPTTEGWTDFPDQTLGTGDTFTVRVIIGSVKTGSETASADDFRKVEYDQNVRSHLTVGFVVDHVAFLGGTTLKVWKKIIVFGPDDYVECPEEKQLSSAETSSAVSLSSPRSSQLPSQPQTEQSLISSSRSSLTSSRSSSHSSSVSSSESQSSNPYSDFSIYESIKTAIVPFRTPRGAKKYVGLFCTEMPDARFEDIVVVKVGRRRLVRRKLDRTFHQVCEPRSIVISSVVASHPVTIGARIERGQVVVECATRPLRSLVVTVRLTGIRRGFAGRRFQQFTRKQMLSNNQFYANAHKPAAPLVIETGFITGRKS